MWIQSHEVLGDRDCHRFTKSESAVFAPAQARASLWAIMAVGAPPMGAGHHHIGEAAWPILAHGKMRNRASGRRILQAQGALMLMEVQFAADADQLLRHRTLRVFAGWSHPSADGGRVHLCAEQHPPRREGTGARHTHRCVHPGARGSIGAQLANSHVQHDREKVLAGQSLSPLLLVAD